MVTSNLTTAKPAEQTERPPSKLFTDYYALVIVALLAVFVAAAFFVLQPRILGVKETNAQTQSTLVTTKQQRTYLTSLEQSVAAAQSIPADSLERVSESMPYQIDQPALLMQFSAAAARNGIQISSITFAPPHTLSTTPILPGSPVQGGSVSTIGIQLSVTGQSYLAMKRFLADIETSLRLMDILSISAGSSAGGESKGVSYQLQLQTYVYSSSTAPLTR